MTADPVTRPAHALLFSQPSRRTMMKRPVSLFLLLCASWLLPGDAAAQSSTARYLVTFESTWSAGTHPDDFPPSPHFSGLIGATHDASATFWEVGGLASPGVENMAETGSKSPLRSEINGAIQAGSAGTVLDGGGIGSSPGSVSLTFDADTSHPLVTLVSMVAPSPDWFVGVAGLKLFDNGLWAERVEVELFAYDAGTDSGSTYTAPDQDTNPQDPIARIETRPFLVDGEVRSVGTFTFVRLSVVAVEEGPGETPGTHRLSAAYPNPFARQAAFTLAVQAQQRVRVDLFDLAGRRVATLFEGTLAPGTPHRFTLDGGALPGGVYLYRVQGETFRASRAVVRAK